MHTLQTFSFLLVICSVPWLVSAVPSSTSHGYRPNRGGIGGIGDSDPPGLQYRYQQGQTPLRIWPKLRDAVVETLWGAPEHDHRKPFSAGRPSGSLSSPAPSSLQARYGNDVVLRFSVESPSQVAALREASNILFLDVWSSTDEWVDIRLAKDVVCRHSLLLSLMHA